MQKKMIFKVTQHEADTIFIALRELLSYEIRKHNNYPLNGKNAQARLDRRLEEIHQLFRNLARQEARFRLRNER